LARGLLGGLLTRVLATVLDDVDPALVTHHHAELVQELGVAARDDEQPVGIDAADSGHRGARRMLTLTTRLRRRLAHRRDPLATDPAGDPQPRMGAALARDRHAPAPSARDLAPA